MTVDHSAYHKALRNAEQDECDAARAADELAEMLARQRVLRTKSLGRAKVDTGYYESMYERLIRAKQSREGIVGDSWEKFFIQRETANLQKHLKANKITSRKNKAKENLAKMIS